MNNAQVKTDKYFQHDELSETLYACICACWYA